MRTLPDPVAKGLPFRAPWLVAAVLVSPLIAALTWPTAGLEVSENGRCLLFLPLDTEERLALVWQHSVAGIAVRDVFARRGETLYLVATFTPYFAAGLGEVPGRGRVVGTHGQGLAIVDIDEPLEPLPLRVGSAEVAHRLEHRGRRYELSARFAGHRLELRVQRRLRGSALWGCARHPARLRGA